MIEDKHLFWKSLGKTTRDFLCGMLILGFMALVIYLSQILTPYLMIIFGLLFVFAFYWHMEYTGNLHDKQMEESRKNRLNRHGDN